MSSKLAKPILAGLCAASCIALVTRTDGLLKLTAFSTGVLTGVYALDKLSGNSLDDVFAGGVHLFKELTYQVPMATDAAATIKITRQEDLRKFLEGSQDKGDLTTPNFWTTDRAKRSAICVGPKHSGKTKIQEFRFQQRLTDPNVHQMVSDIHYDAKTRDGREPPNWMPGAMDEFEQKYLIKSPVETLKYLAYLYEEGRARIKGKTWTQELHFTIEEWQGCVDEWIEIIREQNIGKDPKEKQPEEKLVLQSVRAIKQIFNQFDKVGIQIDLTIHLLTREQTYLNSSITSTCDLYACGSAISTPNQQFPRDLDLKKISAQRAETAIALEIPQRSIIFRDTTFSTWQVVVAPDLRAEFAFELEDPDHVQWLEANKPEIERLHRENRSKTAIASSLGVPQVNTNERWLALKDFVASLEVA